MSVALKAVLMAVKWGVWRVVLMAEKSDSVRVVTSAGQWDCLWAGQRAGWMAAASVDR